MEIRIPYHRQLADSNELRSASGSMTVTEVEVSHYTVLDGAYWAILVVVVADRFTGSLLTELCKLLVQDALKRLKSRPKQEVSQEEILAELKGIRAALEIFASHENKIKHHVQGDSQKNHQAPSILDQQKVPYHSMTPDQKLVIDEAIAAIGSEWHREPH